MKITKTIDWSSNGRRSTIMCSMTVKRTLKTHMHTHTYTHTHRSYFLYCLSGCSRFYRNKCGQITLVKASSSYAALPFTATTTAATTNRNCPYFIWFGVFLTYWCLCARSRTHALARLLFWLLLWLNIWTNHVNVLQNIPGKANITISNNNNNNAMTTLRHNAWNGYGKISRWDVELSLQFRLYFYIHIFK